MPSCILLSLVVLASASFAATHPLSQPRGLAVDAKGNLYVANWAVNQILVYNPAYQQLTGRTIKTGLNGPMELTFDVQGNLWVANLYPGSTSKEYFTEYGPNGSQMNAAYTNSSVANFSAPAFAVDGVGDIWTISADANGQTSIEATNGPNAYSSILDSFYVQSGPYTAVAAHGPWIAFGATNSVLWALSGPVLSSSPSLQRFGSSGNPGQGVLAMTFDNGGNLYYATNQGFGLTGIWFVNIPGAAAPSLNLNIAYQPSGIAADSIHGRFYISNASTNKIEVYSTSTWLLLTTIE